MGVLHWQPSSCSYHEHSRTATQLLLQFATFQLLLLAIGTTAALLLLLQHVGCSSL